MGEHSTKLTLWGVEVFVAIAEEGSISGAARRVSASPSAVSQQLTNLEAALGIALVDRAARPLRLTPAGATFRRRAATILHEAALAQAEISAQDLTRLSSCRLGMIEDFDADVTPRLLSEMGGDLSGCQFLLETGASHHLYEQLGARELDVIVAADIGQSAPWMEVYPLLAEPFVLVLPLGTPAPRGGIGDLAGLPYIQYTQRHYMGRVIAAHLTSENLRPQARFELDSYHAIMAMVAQGVGWTIATPLGVLRAGRFVDEVTMVPLPMAPLRRSISLVARQDLLGAMPRQTASRLRPIVEELIVGPALARYPWLATQLVLRNGQS